MAKYLIDLRKANETTDNYCNYCHILVTITVCSSCLATNVTRPVLEDGSFSLLSFVQKTKLPRDPSSYDGWWWMFILGALKQRCFPIQFADPNLSWWRLLWCSTTHRSTRWRQHRHRSDLFVWCMQVISYEQIRSNDSIQVISSENSGIFSSAIHKVR